MVDSKSYISATGLFFIVLYFVFSVLVALYAIHLTSFKSQVVFLSLPIGFVPQEVFNLLPRTNHEWYSGKERYLIELVSRYPVGMAFMSVFLYAFGWFLEEICKKDWKIAAICVSTFLSLFLILGKHFFFTWPLFIVFLGVIGWFIKPPKQVRN
jgi:hypothetical protein